MRITVERLRAIITDSLCVDIDKVSPTTTLADLDADSFDRVEILTAIEEEFGIMVEDDLVLDKDCAETLAAKLSAG